MRKRSRLFLVAVLLLAFISSPLFAQVSVLTHHGDNARTGANLNETILKVSNVNSKNFGKLAVRPVDGNIYTQPLIATGARAVHRTDPTNLVIVGTERNHVYAFDADDANPSSTSALVWHTGPSTLGPSVETETLTADIKKGICVDLIPDIGITGTPAIQITTRDTPREGVVFVVAKSKTATGYHHTLFALRLSDGAKIASLEIRAEVKGRGLGSVGGKVRFDPMLSLNRAGLLLVGTRLYVAFGPHCDLGDYHGWLFAFDISNPKKIRQIGVWCTTPNGPEPDAPKPPFIEGGAGIWMSGEGPSSDEFGAVYLVTGNGTNNHGSDLGDSVVKVVQTEKTLRVADWFAPENESILKDFDLDLGTSGAVLLPNSHLLIAGGKDGRMYLLDREHLGKASSIPLATFQVTHDSNPPIATYGIYGTPAVWLRKNEMYIYTAGVEDPVRQFRMVRDPAGAGWKFASPQPFIRGSVTAPYPDAPQGQFGRTDRSAVWTPGGFMTLSANGADGESGILWVTMPAAANANHTTVRGVLRALDATDVSKPEIWNSENTGDENDRVGYFAKFVPPTVANGRVYVATFQKEPTADDEAVTTGTGGEIITRPETRAALVIYGLH